MDNQNPMIETDESQTRSLADRNNDHAEHHFNLIASAIAGRTITVHWHNNPRLPAYTDAQSVFLPNTPSEQGSEVIEVITQALLLRSGGLNRKQLQSLLGRSNLAERYAQAELARAIRANQSILPRRYTDHPELSAFPYTSNDPEDSLALAKSNKPFPNPPSFLGKLRITLLLRSKVPDTAFTALTKRQQEGKMEFREVEELDDADQDDAEESKILKLFQNPLMSGGAIGDMLNKILGAGRSGKPEDNPDDSGSEMSIGSITQKQQTGVFATLTELALDIVTNQQSNDIGSKSYPEWDFTTKSYRQNWTLVDEMDPWREGPEPDATFNQLLQPPGPTLKRKLAGIGLSLETHYRQHQGEDIALDSLVEYMRDLRMGITPSDHIYKQRMRTRRDLAAMVLLDVSGSTGEKDQQGLSIHHRQMQLTYHMTRTLHELGDQVSCYAFHSWGRSLVRLLRIKSFAEKRIDSGVRKRLAMLEPAGYTRTGAALRHAAHKLHDETGMPYRMLIVVTDGFSYDQNYEGKYGEEDTKKALQEIRSAGVGCLCLTIGSSQEREKLADIYGAASTLSVEDYQQFLAHLRPAVLKAIGQISR